MVILVDIIVPVAVEAIAAGVLVGFAIAAPAPLEHREVIQVNITVRIRVGEGY